MPMCGKLKLYQGSKKLLRNPYSPKKGVSSISTMKTELNTFFSLELVLVPLELTKKITISRTLQMIDAPVVMELKQQRISCLNAPFIKNKEKSYYLRSILLSLKYILKTHATIWLEFCCTEMKNSIQIKTKLS